MPTYAGNLLTGLGDNSGLNPDDVQAIIDRIAQNETDIETLEAAKVNVSDKAAQEDLTAGNADKWVDAALVKPIADSASKIRAALAESQLLIANANGDVISSRKTLAQIATDISTAVAASLADAKADSTAKVAQLKSDLLGADVVAALDTFTEIAAWIAADETATASMLETIAAKVDRTVYDAFVTATNNTLATKADKTTFDSFVTATNAALATKSDATHNHDDDYAGKDDYNRFVTETNEIIDLIKQQASFTLHVNKNGSNEAGDGTLTKPFATIEHAINITPENSVVTVIARGANNKILAHEVTAGINIKFRSVRLDLLNDYVRVMGEASDVFLGSTRAELEISGGVISLSGNKSFYFATKKSNFTLTNTKFLLPDNAILRFMALGDASVSTLSFQKVQVRNSNDTAEAIANTRGVNGSAALINNIQSTLGTKYNHGGAVVNIAGGLFAISNA